MPKLMKELSDMYGYVDGRTVTNYKKALLLTNLCFRAHLVGWGYTTNNFTLGGKFDRYIFPVFETG